MKSAQSLIQSIRRQLDATPWLKWAAAAIAILAALLVAQSLDALRTRTEKQAIDAEVNLRRIRALQGQDVWLTREKAAAELLATLNAQIPSAGTPGLAQAAIQAWLNDLAGTISNVTGLKVTVEEAARVTDFPDLIRVTATFAGGMTPRQALNVVRQIEESTNLVSIETIDVRNDSNKLMSLRVSAYYRLPSAEAAP